MLDSELADLTKGGVNAVSRQTNQMRQEAEHEVNLRAAQNERRARKKDIILAQNGMMNQREEEKKSPAKLGPSTIRTLIRAAESRPQ